MRFRRSKLSAMPGTAKLVGFDRESSECMVQTIVPETEKL